MTLLVLSPHLDDAALCAAGPIQLSRTHNIRVIIVSIFAGFPPPGNLSSLARAFHNDCGLSINAVTTRRAEDAAAAKILDTNIAWLDYPDAIYRTNAGMHIYSCREALFGRPVDADAICTAAARRISRQFSDVDELLIPLGAGGHVDHKITRQIGEILRCSARRRTAAWYEESLYAGQLGADAWHGVDIGRLTPQDIALPTPIWDRKRAAVECYRSQTAMLGIDLRDPDSPMSGCLRTERIWSDRAIGAKRTS